MNSLLEHIELLETRLKEVESGSPRPLDAFPPPPLIQTTSQGEDNQNSQTTENIDLDLSHTSPEEPEPPRVSGPSDPSSSNVQNFTPTSNLTFDDSNSVRAMSLSGRDQAPSGVPFLPSSLFETPRLQYNSVTGQLSFPDAASKLCRYGKGLLQPHSAPSGPWHIQRRLHHIIKELDQSTYGHLMACFWSSYNDKLQLIDQEAFQRQEVEDRDQPHYSVFLHVCCLAIGFRFADKSRSDIQALARGNRDSTFHENVRYMVEAELERPHGLTTIQSLLILSDLECAMGRTQPGWMYAGASKFDHVDLANSSRLLTLVQDSHVGSRWR